jgi:hypothetical protein
MEKIKNELRPEIEINTFLNKPRHTLFSLMKSWSALRAEKIKIYKEITRPMAIYIEKFWTLTEGTAKRLAVFEKVLRRSFLGELK